MSEVRRGEDVLLGRPVAIKLLLDDGDPRSAARFQQEAQILARLQHPNVITVFDSGADGGERFIVMELVEGPTLRELLDTEGRLAPERAGEIASRLASALEFAHGKGVIHRDVKPSNVLLPPDGGVKLADMGIARLLSPEALTATLSVRGTAAYISPEQVRGDSVDSRADLYSLGCVLFEMLTGRTPFEGDLAALSYAHTHTPAPRVRSINPAVPAAIDELVAAMLEKDPAQRPTTGEEVQRSLASALSRDVEPTAVIEPVQPPPSPLPRPPAGGRRRRGPKAWPTGVIVVGGLATLLFIAMLARAEPDGRTDASQRSPQLSSSPATQQPSPVETSSPAPEQPSPVDTSSPAPEQPSPQEAAAIVLDTVGEGIETGEITDHFDHDIRHTIDEILRDADKGEDVDGLLEKVDDLREKVSEALEKGEITSADRASAIDQALLTFAEALRDAER